MAMNGEAVHAGLRKTWMVCNANMMHNGADCAVLVNTTQEFDGNDSGAHPYEAVSWGKISRFY